MRAPSLINVDSNVRLIYQFARADDADPPGIAELIARIHGPTCIEIMPEGTTRDSGTFRTSPIGATFAAARTERGGEFAVHLSRALVSWWLSERLQAAVEPPVAERLAHALLLPTPALREAYARGLRTPEAVSAQFSLPSWVAAARFAIVPPPCRASVRRIPLVS